MVRAGNRGIRQLGAQLPVLANPSRRPSRIPAPRGRPLGFSRPSDIQIFSVGYMKIEQASRADWIYTPDGPDAPADPLGWKPVQLVPENARAGRGGFPLSVRPGENQALWFEINTGRGPPARPLPRDHHRHRRRSDPDGPGRARAPPGSSLPDESALAAMVYYESEQPQRYTRARSGRRLSPLRPPAADRAGARPMTSRACARRRGRFDGSDFAPRAVRGARARASGTGSCPPPSTARDRAGRPRPAAWSKADAWMTFLAEHLPRRHHLPLHARRAAARAVPRSSARWPTTSTPARAPAGLCRPWSPAASPPSWRGPSTSGARWRGSSIWRRRRASARPGATGGSTTAAVRPARPW